MPCDAGSNPVGATLQVSMSKCPSDPVAQWPERLSYTQGGGGSTPSGIIRREAGFVVQRQSIRLLTGRVQVRILPKPLRCSAAGSAPGSYPGGRGFESHHRYCPTDSLCDWMVKQIGDCSCLENRRAGDGLGGSTPSPSACGRSSVARAPHCDCGDVGSTPTGHPFGALPDTGGPASVAQSAEHDPAMVAMRVRFSPDALNSGSVCKSASRRSVKPLPDRALQVRVLPGPLVRQYCRRSSSGEHPTRNRADVGSTPTGGC